MRYTDQCSGTVKQVNQEKDENHADHADGKQPFKIHLHKSRRNARHFTYYPVEFIQTHQAGDNGNGQDGNDDCTLNAEVSQNNHHSKTEQCQQRRRLMNIAQTDQGCRIGNDNTRTFQGNQCQKQTDTGSNRHF